MNWTEFFHMGGYAFFVWPSYALALVVIAGNIIEPIIRRKKVIAQVKRAIKREAMNQPRL